MGTQPVLLVIGSVPPATHDTLLQGAAQASPLVLLAPHPPTWERRHLVDSIIVDPQDPAALTAAVDELADGRELAGIMAFTEQHLAAAAAQAARRALPGHSPRAVHASQNKAENALHFTIAGIPCAASTWVHSYDAAIAAVDRLGYPVVLKPASDADGHGVARADTPAHMPAAWVHACIGAAEQVLPDAGVLIQEYLPGPAVSVETVTHRGRTTAVAITRWDIAPTPDLPCLTHTVDARDHLLDELAPLAGRAVAALGITDGVCSVEMRLTPTGPRILEVNARTGSGAIGYLVHLATGIDLGRAAADLAVGNSPNLTATRAATAAARMFHSATSGILREHHLLLDGTRSWLRRVVWLRDAGEPVAAAPLLTTVRHGAIGLAVVTADTPDQAQRYLDDLSARVVITTRVSTSR